MSFPMSVVVERTIRRVARTEKVIRIPPSWQDRWLAVGQRVSLRYEGGWITIAPVRREVAH